MKSPASPLARRVQGLAQSDIRAITRMVRDVDGINLGQGVCDMPVPEPMREAAKAAIDAGRSTYTGYDGIRRLRTAILDKLQRYNHLPAQSDREVMVTPGSTGAFVAALMTLLEPGDEVLLFEPFYGYHRNIVELLGGRVRSVPLREPDWSVDFDAVEAAVTERTRVVVACTPANPSGKVWSREELERLLALMRRHDLTAITDEIYEYMLYDGREHVSLASLPGAWERTITISGLSKTYNVTGWRLGYAAGPEPMIAKMGLVADLLYICPPAPLQYGAAAAFEMDDRYFDELQASYAHKRRLLCETLEAIGFEVYWPQGAYYVLADFRPLANSRDGFADSRAACETLIHEAGVGTVPGPSFFDEPEHGDHLLRFCFAKELPVLEEACERLSTLNGR